jgi:hypothetical protein
MWNNNQSMLSTVLHKNISGESVIFQVKPTSNLLDEKKDDT